MTFVQVRRYVVAAALLIALALPAFGAVEVLDAHYRPDFELAQYHYFWKSTYRPGDDPPAYYMSGALIIYLRNTGPAAETITDVYLQGVSLKRAFGCKPGKTYRDGLAYACSIHIPSNDPITTTERQTLIDAGEPVWYRIDTETVNPGGTAEVYIRMRVRLALSLSLVVTLQSGGTIPISITVSSANVPRVADFALSPSMDKLYLYFKHMQTGKSPIQVLLDGVDVTGQSTIGSDANRAVIPVVCNLAAPWTKGSFHCFQAVYDDGKKASAGARVFAEELVYALWGGPNGTTPQEGQAHVADMGRHGFNNQFLGANGANDYMKTPEGLAQLDQLGIWRIVNDSDKAYGRLSEFFLCDEPDVGDAAVPTTAVPAYAQLGALAESLVYRRNTFRATYPTYPTIVNLDSTFKPNAWYTYGQLADIFAADPYYQVRLADAYWTKPYHVPIYAKATYIYAVTSVCKMGCQPKPFHVILNCTRKQDGAKVFRFATPEEKRMEVYYALAGGAKHFSYWWFTPTDPTTASSCGVGSDEPEAAAFWREMGLLGAEARTAGPVLVRSTPEQLSVTAPGDVWVRTLLAGLDTVVVLCMNDDYTNDRAGTSIRPVEDVEVSLQLPAWLNPTDVFEVSYKGIGNVPYSRTGPTLTMDLATVKVSRMIIITSDPNLRSALGQLYNTKFGPNVWQLIPVQ